MNAAKTHARRLLEGLMERHEHLRDSAVLRLQGGVIPVALLRQIAEPRAMLVGDATGQVKPTSGGRYPHKHRQRQDMCRCGQSKPWNRVW